MQKPLCIPRFETKHTYAKKTEKNEIEKTPSFSKLLAVG